MRHPLVRLAGLIDWPEIERTFGATSAPVAADLHCLLVWSPACCTCSTPSMPRTKPSSTPGSRTRIGSTSAARSTCRPKRPSIRAASRAGRSASARKVWKLCSWPPLRLRGAAVRRRREGMSHGSNLVGICKETAFYNNLPCKSCTRERHKSQTRSMGSDCPGRTTKARPLPRQVLLFRSDKSSSCWIVT